ncbi:MAG: right-handed parallel beta-helix repeat-containing protein, partial [Candidatus Lokiarchaeota archaeon]
SCHDNTFQNNEMIGNAQSGMELMVSTDNIIIENTINDNALVGLDFGYADNNNVTANIINNNEGNFGIYLDNSDNNTIAENQIMGQKGTIYQGSCSGNIIINNIYEILSNFLIEISDQIFTTNSFNITFFIHDDNNVGITLDSIEMEWNGTDVSSAVINIGSGLYFIALTPITVSPGDDPILLNMTVSADGYVVKHFEVNLAVDPETLIKNTPQNPSQPTIPGYNLIVLFTLLSCVSLI